MSDILADDVGEGLASEFEAAANDPDGFDFGFEKQREATGFANFGFDPARAEQLRAADPSNQPAPETLVYPDDDEDEDTDEWDTDFEDDEESW